MILLKDKIEAERQHLESVSRLALLELKKLESRVNTLNSAHQTHVRVILQMSGLITLLLGDLITYVSKGLEE